MSSKKKIKAYSFEREENPSNFEIKFVNKKGKKISSFVWDYFGSLYNINEKKVEDEQYHYCQLCFVDYVTLYLNGTVILYINFKFNLNVS